jgi:hypothetical protein
MHSIAENDSVTGECDRSFNGSNDDGEGLKSNGDNDNGDDNDNNDSNDLLTITAMTQLYAHISAMGYYGSTGFIHPLYGLGELPQVYICIYTYF